MNEDEITEYVVEPRLHDRWSLLTLGVGFIGDIAATVANYTATAAMMTAQHAKQKAFDNKFREMPK